MDKKSASRGLIRLNQSDYKNSIRLLQHGSKNNEREYFEINTNDFPSLTDVSEKKGRNDRTPLDSSRWSFSYSDKLKTTPQEAREYVKAESISKNLSKQGFVSNNEHLVKKKNEPHKKDTKCHRLYNGNLESDSLDNHATLEKAKGKFIHKSSDYNDKHNFETKSYTQNSVKEKRSCDVTNQKVDRQHYSTEKERTHFKSIRGNPISNGTNVSKPTKSVESFNASHLSSKDEWVLRTKIKEQNSKKSEEDFHKKESSLFKNKVKSVPSTSHSHVDKGYFHTRTESAKTVDMDNTSKNVSYCESQTIATSCEKDKASNQYHNLGSKSKQGDAQPLEIKKKKKRKSRVKRQAAMQTGKIFVLTPEAHSKILNQSRILNTQVQKNTVTDINDSEEYPELGTTTVPKVNKESSNKTIEINLKKEIPTLPDKNDAAILVQIEPSSEVSENISPNIEATRAAVMKDDEKVLVETINKEKSPAHAKDVITVSLFDMLLSAKSKKKEPEKKNDAVGGDSPTKVVKNSSKISARKAVSQFVNPLDSSRPAVKRGKEREKPKIKRPSRMRKLILLGRKLRKEELAMKDENLVDESNTVESDIHSGDNLLSSKLHALDKKDLFMVLCSGNKTDFFTFDGSEELGCISSSEQTESNTFLSNEECQDKTDLCNEYYPSCKHNELDNFSNDSDVIMPTAQNKENYSLLLHSNDALNLEKRNDKQKTEVLLKSANDTILTVTPKSHISNRLAAHFSMESTSSNDDAVQISKNRKLDECVFEETKCVIENLISHVEKENPTFTKTKSTPVKKIEDCRSKLLSNSKSVDMNINSIKSEYYSCSEDIDDNEVPQIEEVFYSISESPIATSLNITENDTTSHISATNINCSVKTEIHNVDAISVCNTNFMTKAYDSDVFYKNENENTLSNSISKEISPLIESDVKSTDSDIVPNITISVKQVENNSMNLFSDEEKFEAVKILIHTRKFRQYCNHFISKEIDKVVFTLLDDLARFQDRMHQKDPVKARVRKRLLYGIKEIMRHMKLKKLKCIILATDIEDIKTEGGLNDVIKEIISLAEALHIPYIFSHRRFNLGKVCRKAVPVSCVGIFNYEGSEKNFKRALELQLESKEEYINVTKAIVSILTNDQITEIFKLSKGVPERIYELRSAILKNSFGSSVEQKENESINISGISTDVNNCSTVEELKNSECSSEPKGFISFALNNDVSASVGSKELNKNEVFNIFKKYNLV